MSHNSSEFEKALMVERNAAAERARSRRAADEKMARRASEAAAIAERRRLLHIGNPLDEFFDERGIALCAGFLEVAKRNDMRGSSELVDALGGNHRIRAYPLGIKKFHRMQPMYIGAFPAYEYGVFLSEAYDIRGDDGRCIEGPLTSVYVCEVQHRTQHTTGNSNANGDSYPGGGHGSSYDSPSTVPYVAREMSLKDKLLSLATENHFDL